MSRTAIGDCPRCGCGRSVIEDGSDLMARVARSMHNGVDSADPAFVRLGLHTLACHIFGGSRATAVNAESSFVLRAIAGAATKPLWKRRCRSRTKRPEIAGRAMKHCVLKMSDASSRQYYVQQEQVRRRSDGGNVHPLRCRVYRRIHPRQFEEMKSAFAGGCDGVVAGLLVSTTV